MVGGQADLTILKAPKEWELTLPKTQFKQILMLILDRLQAHKHIWK